MTLEQELYGIEHALGDGDGDAYRRHLTDDAVVIVPGASLGREETARAIDAGPGWDDTAFDDERLLRLGDDIALLVYRFSGTRGEDAYAALMASVYVERDGEWRLAFHQQTPLA
jgi:hypothetical protein